MNYLIFGNEPFIIRNTLNKIVKQEINEVNEFNFVSFDASKTLMNEIILEADHLPLGVDKKVIVIDEAYFLETRPSNKGPKDNDLTELISFLAHPSEEITLIFIVNNEKINKKAEIYKSLEKVSKIYEAQQITKEQWPEYVRRTFARREVKIDNDAVNELVKRMNGDAILFENEAAKLATFTNHLTLKDITTMVAKSSEENAFTLTNALLEKDLGKVLEIYADFKIQGVEPTSFITMIGNQFRLYSQVFILRDQNNNEREIAEKLGVHPYRVKLALNAYRKDGVKKVNDVLEQLYNLDYQIKSGQLDRYYGFEMFLINYCTK